MGAVVRQVALVPEQDRYTESATEKKFTRTYRVVYHPPGESGATILGDPYLARTATDGTTSVPAYANQLVYGSGTDVDDTGLYVVDKQGQRGSDPTVIDVFVTYGTLSFSGAET